MNSSFNSPQLKKVCKDQGIEYLGLFGSHARGEATSKSDIDLLVRFKKSISLFDLARTQNVFTDLFKKPVDLVLEKSLKPKLKPYIKKDLLTIYEKK